MPTRLATGVLALVLTFLTACTSVIPAIAPGVPSEPGIGAAFPYQSRYADVLGSRLHYVEQGQGPVVLLLHGNPTSSYLWRNVIPHLSGQFRVIAPDLIGMGQSGKPDIAYSLADHIRYVDAFISRLDLHDITLVLHGPGGAIGLDYLARQPENVRGVAFAEALVRPLSYDDFDPFSRYLFQQMRDPQNGPDLILAQNYFVERLIPMLAGRWFSKTEMQAYRRPFLSPIDRRPILAWVRELPIDGHPSHSHDRIARNYRALQRSDVPLLLLFARPGGVIGAGVRDQMRRELPHLQQIDLGTGLHYLPETHPRAFGASLAAWIAALPPITAK